MVVSLRLCCTRFSCAAQELPFNKKTASNVIECRGRRGGGGMDTTPLFTYPANSGFSRPDATLCTNMCLSTVILLGVVSVVPAVGVEKPLLAG